MVVERIGATLSRLELTSPGETLVVGVSGGPDSLFLLDVLHNLSAALRISLHVAHLDHQLRPDSALDASVVADFARTLGCPTTVETVDVARLAHRRRLGIEETARVERYAFFARVVSATEASGVALGHTADDQVETIVLSLIRGAGPAGLRGMRPVSERQLPGLPRPLRVIRPLLDVTRAEVEAYLQARGIQPRRDPTNDEVSYRRNKLRHEVLPDLRTLNPRFDDAVLRLGRLTDADEAYFEGRLAELWPAIADAREAAVSLGRGKLRGLSKSLSSRLVRRAYVSLVGDAQELEAVHVEAALRLLESGRTGAAIEWPREIRVRLEYEALVVERAICSEPQVELADEAVELRVPGTTILATGARVVARLTAEPCRGEDPARDHVDLDLHRAGGKLAVRRRRAGDRIVPLGMQAEKKLQDLLVDARIPRSERDRVPIIVCPEGIVWVAGVRADDRYRCTDATRAVLCLQLSIEDQSETPQR